MTSFPSSEFCSSECEQRVVEEANIFVLRASNSYKTGRCVPQRVSPYYQRSVHESHHLRIARAERGWRELPNVLIRMFLDEPGPKDALVSLVSSWCALGRKDTHGRHSGNTACSMTFSLRVGTSCSTQAKAKAFLATSMTCEGIDTAVIAFSKDKMLGTLAYLYRTIPERISH